MTEGRGYVTPFCKICTK